jgi:hypothetical protein
MSRSSLVSHIYIYIYNCLFCILIHVSVASNALDEAKALIAGHDNAESTSLDISNNEDLNKLVSKADVVVR